MRTEFSCSSYDAGWICRRCDYPISHQHGLSFAWKIKGQKNQKPKNVSRIHGGKPEEDKEYLSAFVKWFFAILAFDCDTMKKGCVLASNTSRIGMW
jgi:hypothetical protein